MPSIPLIQLLPPHAINFGQLYVHPIHLLRDVKLMDAQVHDTCQGRGKYFVITNYTRWAFGEFSSSRLLVDYLSFITYPHL